MGSITDYLKCPQCGGLIIETRYYRSGEEDSYCERCGRSESIDIKKTENGQYMKDEQTGQFVYEHKFSPGRGTIRIAYDNGVSHIFSLSPEDGSIEEMKSKFFKALQESSSIIKEKSFFGVWDDEKKEVVAVHGELPPLYDDVFEIPNQESENQMSEEEFCAKLDTGEFD